MITRLLSFLALQCIGFSTLIASESASTLNEQIFQIDKDYVELLWEQGKPIKSIDNHTFEISEALPFKNQPNGSSTILDTSLMKITAKNSKDNLNLVKEFLTPTPNCGGISSPKQAEQDAAANP